MTNETVIPGDSLVESFYIEIDECGRYWLRMRGTKQQHLMDATSDEEAIKEVKGLSERLSRLDET